MAVTIGSATAGRTIEKLFEDAESSGKLIVKNRRLKDIGHYTYKYELKEISYIDLTLNRLHELPTDAYDWNCCETLILSHNVIKSLPDFIADFKLLQVLDLSNNQLSVFSSQICELRSIKVLSMANNKILSIPEEISNLALCQELNMSNNKITSLPIQIIEMKSLKCLNIRKNCIQSLPEQMWSMKITHLDAGCNNISVLPISFRNLPCIEEFNVDHNPLTSPQLHILRKGYIHAFKELTTAAEKIQIKKDVMEDAILSPKKLGSMSDDFRMFDLGPRSWTTSAVSDKTAEMFATEAGNLSKGRRQKSNPSSPTKRATEVMRSSSVRVAPTAPPVIPTNPVKKAVSNPPTNPLKQTVSNPDKPEVKLAKTNSKRITSALYSSPNGIVRKSSSDSLLKGSKPKPGFKKTSTTTTITKYKPKLRKVNGVGSPPQEEKQQTHNQLREFVKHRKALSPNDSNIRSQNVHDVIKPRAVNSAARRRVNTAPESAESFTIRRKTEKIYEEIELIEEMRQSIESRLKTSLGDNIQAELSNGITLCHLTNHVRPRSIPSIHVPSPAVPVLSRAKCRRNVDNFIETCKRIGVSPNYMCTSQDILEQKNISQICLTVKELLKRFPGSTSPRKAMTNTPVVKIAPSLVHTKSQSAV